MSDKPVCNLVWLQGRRAADDVEDYYEVARPGDKSVDGSDPFPVYMAPSTRLREAAIAIIPASVSLTNQNIPDDTIIPIDVTMGELRRLSAALAE